MGYTEQIIIAATVTLVAGWIKLLRSDGSPRLRTFCGLLAYFFPIVGPIAILFLLSERTTERPPQWIANPRHTCLRQAAI